MKENSLTIVINCPVEKVFEFTLNPQNTPKWIDGILKEERLEENAGMNAIYRNLNKEGIWNEYRIIEFKPNQSFTMQQSNSPYFVRYTFKAIGKDFTEFTYFEWVQEGELEASFDQSPLSKLKNILEKLN